MPPGEIRESEPARVVFPMQLRVGDRLSNADGEWEVVGEPSDLYGGKMVEAWLARPEDHAARSTWPGPRTRRSPCAGRPRTRRRDGSRPARRPRRHPRRRAHPARAIILRA